MCVVHAVARAEVDFQFRHAIREIAVLTGIAIDQAVDTNQDTCSSSSISQRVKPLAILVRLLYAHEAIVAQGLHTSR